MTNRRRHSNAFDLRGITDRAHKQVLQDALDVCDFPFSRIPRRVRARVPVTVTDTSRWTASLAVHAVTSPENRAAALGLYWLPTSSHPAGRIEVGTNAIGDADLAREVFIAEAAHAVDLATMTEMQRRNVFVVVHGGDPADHGTHGWWEERGGRDYWSDWAGEAFMALFCRAFAPLLPRPLESRQPWTHALTDSMRPLVRRSLNVRQ